MPAVPAPAKILVSGANGYIAIWVVRNLLEKGYSVRGTVRSAAKGKHLQEIFKEYGDKHEVVVVEDITKEGAFDEAVKGVDAIEHTASPFHTKGEDPDEYIVPAVKGTVGILESALKYGTSVKRVVVTSSCAAVLTPTSPVGTTYTDEDWNKSSVETTEKLGRAAPVMEKYRASKTLAEKSAWAFVEKHKSEIAWDLVVLNPPYVFGPVLHQVDSPSSLNESMRDWFHTVLQEVPPAKLKLGSGWIDVRDLATAHVLALEKSEAGGGRIVVSAGSFLWQDWLDAANALSPPPLGAYTLPKGTPGAGKAPGVLPPMFYDTSKASRVLGLTYRSLEETARDSLADFGSRGWVN
ncbi:hypothetical protein PLICRDRAFT_114782 [Plicaturopsis crispa FD-325 SS-3]|nr:hypothetical protein PLICRDRAFT_114782 [Plicaturopsis crispa FD-325 SS-3]